MVRAIHKAHELADAMADEKGTRANRPWEPVDEGQGSDSRGDSSHETENQQQKQAAFNGTSTRSPWAGSARSCPRPWRTQANPPAAGSGANPNLPGSEWDPAWNTNLIATTDVVTSVVKCDEIHQTRMGSDDQRPMS